MAKRTGPSISVKMIITSTLLILLIVVGFGFLNYFNVRSVFDKTTEQTVEQRRKALSAKGVTTTKVFAKGVLKMLIDNEDSQIRSLVKETALQDEELLAAWVIDRNQNVLARCDVIVRDGKAQCDPAKLPKDERKKIDDVAWKELLARWAGGKAAAQGDGQAATADDSDALLAKYETATGRAARFFAYPVFTGELTAEDAAKPTAIDNRWGYAVLSYDLQPIKDFALKSQKEKRAAARASAMRTGAAGALFVLIGIVLAIFQGLSISRPIKLLAWKADQIARGDLEARVEVTSTDELGLLGENFNFMADQLVVLLHQTAEKAQMEKELEVARTIQDTLVPPNDPIDFGFIQLAGYFQPASQCGGDWWTYHKLVEDKLLVVIGDVTGHGVPSAMITATAKAACDVACDVNNNDLTVETVLHIMNNAIFESAKRKFVMTCFASILDPRARTITYANAGHNFPYLYRQKEGGRGEFGSLMIRGNRLGDLRESTYESKTTELTTGDTIIWYTDGIVECESEMGEEYGEKKFRASIRRAGHLEAGELRDKVIAEAMTFYGNMPRKDDISMVMGRVV